MLYILHLSAIITLEFENRRKTFLRKKLRLQWRHMTIGKNQFPPPFVFSNFARLPNCVQFNFFARGGGGDSSK